MNAPRILAAFFVLGILLAPAATMSSLKRCGGGLFSPIVFRSGTVWKNAFMLAPLTNKQSNEDGTLSQDEYDWLTYRAEGGFGLVMTCAAHVQVRNITRHADCTQYS